MENLSPIIFLIIYLVISGISKRRKADRQNRRSGERPPVTVSKDTRDRMRALYKALGLDEEAQPQPAPGPVSEKETDRFETVPTAAESTSDAGLRTEPGFQEGGKSLPESELPEDLDVYSRPVEQPYEQDDREVYERPVETPYQRPEPTPYGDEEASKDGLSAFLAGRSTLEQGMYLQMILGPPRALQPLKDWLRPTQS